MRRIWKTLSVLLGIIIINSASLEALPLSDYLKLVEEQSPQIRAARERVAAAERKQSEPQLVFSPELFGGLKYWDEKSLGTSGIQKAGDKTQVWGQNLGVRKLWGSGTHTSLQHLIQRNDVEGIPGLTEAFWTNSFELRIEQSLWKNFLGKETRNRTKSMILSLQALAERERFQIRQLLDSAEKLYWQVALTRAITKSIEESLKRTQGILDYNRKRLDLNLVDKSDVLQSSAAVLQLKQSLEDSRTREQEAVRQLHLFIQTNLEPDFPTDVLEFKVEDVKIPETWNPENRGDLNALKLLAEAELADAASRSSSLYPDLNLFGSYSGNSFDTSFGAAEKEVFKNDFRRYEIGLRLEVPLSFKKLSDVRAAEYREAKSAELVYMQARREFDYAFQNLRGQVQEVLRKLEFAKELEKTQRDKLKNEDTRYRQGRSSSFQLLRFEEDLALAELEVLKLYAQLRGLLSELRLYQ